MGFLNRVFRIESFLEKVIAENPSLVDYKVLAVKKEFFGNIDVKDSFFDTFSEDYCDFDSWFNRKADDVAYVCYNAGVLSAFLYLKVESAEEPYFDISPVFSPKRRLKIGTLKVTNTGFRLGERFLKIVFDNAIRHRVEEIYVTIFDKREEQLRLIELLESWGFRLHGLKTTSTGNERVYVRDFSKENVDRENPRLTFPRLSRDSDVFIVPIFPEYHTELFPDSILNTESPNEFIENEPHRNSLSKVYISHSRERNLRSGDVIVFYRTGGLYKSVATTIGIVENVADGIRDFDELKRLCRNRTALNEEKLLEYWNRWAPRRPFVVNFLYAFSLPKRPNMSTLIELGVIKDVQSAPRGFEKISWECLDKIKEFAYKK